MFFLYRQYLGEKMMQWFQPNAQMLLQSQIVRDVCCTLPVLLLLEWGFQQGYALPRGECEQVQLLVSFRFFFGLYPGIFSTILRLPHGLPQISRIITPAFIIVTSECLAQRCPHEGLVWAFGRITWLKPSYEIARRWPAHLGLSRRVAGVWPARGRLGKAVSSGRSWKQNHQSC